MRVTSRIFRTLSGSIGWMLPSAEFTKSFHVDISF